MTRLARRFAGDDDGFAMIFTLMMMFVVFATSMVVAGVLLAEIHPTLFAKKSVHTGDAAQGGLQAAIGQLRNTTTNGVGDLTKLPCSDPQDSTGVSVIVGSPQQTVTLPGYQITGSTSTDGVAANAAAYRAVVVYFTSDPTAHETDSTTSWWTNNAITCRAGLVNVPPTYAYVQSFGSGPQLSSNLSPTLANRTVHAIYQFSATNTNTVGGRIKEFGSANPALCLDAGSNPAVGTTMTVQPCLALGTASQTWQYRSDLTIFYGGNTTLNLCVENVSGTPKLKTCTGTGAGATYPYGGAQQQNQEWGFNDNGHFSAALSNGDVTEGSGGGCLEPSGATSGTQAASGAALVITSCDTATTGFTAWNPDPQAGAGKAGGNTTGAPGAPTNQFVNYAELGRCLDVTGQSVGNGYLIDYPCKQSPDSSKLTWNQVWHYQVVSGNYGIFYTVCPAGAACNTNGSSNASAINDCVTAPASGASNNYVYVSPCLSTPSNAQLWQTTGNIAGNYPNSYLLISKLTGLCMGSDPSVQPTFGSSTIVATACDGSGVPSAATTKNYLLLKWNAPPFNPTPGLSNIQEDGGSTLTHAG